MFSTLINIVGILVSIAGSIASWKFALNAKEIKKEILLKTKYLGLITFIDEAHATIKDFIIKANKAEWGKGKNVTKDTEGIYNLIIDANKYTKIFQKEDQKKFDLYLKKIKEHIHCISSMSNDEKKDLLDALLGLDKFLQESNQECHDKIAKD